MPVARTSFSASLLPILPAVTNPPEVRLFDLDDVVRAEHMEISVESENATSAPWITYFLDTVTDSADRQDAKASLAFWIFDIFDDLASGNPQTLGRTPALQIRVLNEYISRRA